MRFRKLRIAWSVACVLTCVLLIAFWARSYWRWDIVIKATAQQVIAVSSQKGALVFQYGDVLNPANAYVVGWVTENLPALNQDLLPFNGIEIAHAGPLFVRNFDEYILTLPYWLSVSLTLIVGAIPWLRLRFSLRTMLIGTTFIAAMLGLIVYVIKK